VAAVKLDRLDRAGRLVLLVRLGRLGRRASGGRLVRVGLLATKESRAPLDLQGHLDRLAKRGKRARRGLLDLQVKRASKGLLDLKAKGASRARRGLLDLQALLDLQGLLRPILRGHSSSGRSVFAIGLVSQRRLVATGAAVRPDAPRKIKAVRRLSQISFNPIRNLGRKGGEITPQLARPCGRGNRNIFKVLRRVWRVIEPIREGMKPMDLRTKAGKRFIAEVHAHSSPPVPSLRHWKRSLREKALHRVGNSVRKLFVHRELA
jgi:hypothetical protein